MAGFRSVAWSELLASALSGALLAVVAEELGAWQVFGVARPSALFAGAVSGVVGFRTPVREWLPWLAASVVVIYLAIAWSPLASSLAGSWVRADPDPAERPGAVVVLSSSVRSDSTIDHVATDRLLSAVSAARSVPGAMVVTTRVIGHNSVSSDWDQMRILAIAGLSDRHVILDTVRSTMDEARRAAVALHGAGHRRITLVTSPMHTRRACAMFESVGFEVHCVPARERHADTWHPAGSTSRLVSFRTHVYERLAMLKWRFRRDPA